jgi:hypothetical protein
MLKDFEFDGTNEFARQCLLAMSVVCTADMNPSLKMGVLKKGGYVASTLTCFSMASSIA